LGSEIYGNRIVWTVYHNGDENPDIYMFTISGKPAPKMPVANFFATPTSGKAPMKVKFTSTITGVPTTWKWSFGDGSALVTEQNPEHIYSKSGIYTVKHTASNVAGKDTEIKTNYVCSINFAKGCFFSVPNFRICTVESDIY
jgi:PKD repeat protein